MKFLGQLNENPLKETHIYQGLPILEEENIEGKIVIIMVLEGHVGIRDSLRKKDILTKVGNPLTKEDTLAEDPLMETEDPLMMEEPW